MSTQAQISKDIVDAMKTKNEVKLRVLRQLKNAMTNSALLSGNANNPIADADVLVLVRKQIAQRQDSIKQFMEGNRPELAETEQLEINELKGYLPAELSDEDIDAIVAQALTDTLAVTKKQMGAAIKRAVELAKGAVDNKTLSQKIGQLLN